MPSDLKKKRISVLRFIVEQRAHDLTPEQLTLLGETMENLGSDEFVNLLTAAKELSLLN